MDGLQSFSHLVDSIPLWTERVNTLSQQVSERHAEFAALAKASGDAPPSIRRDKTGSMESLRPRDEANNIAEPPSTIQRAAKSPPSTPPLRVDINPDSKRLFQDYRIQAKRKRASASMLSAVSGTQKFRSRLSLIVFYDSAIQENFEWLVRNIASARNNLRKGKTSASFKARIAGMGMEESPFVGDRTSYSMRNPRVPRLPRSGGKFNVGGYSPEPFDQADRELETAQSLCEIGAHQFLRDGVCMDELSGTRERFETCLRLAKDQKEVYETLEKEDTSIGQERKTSEPTIESPEASATSSGSSTQVDSTVAIDPLMIDKDSKEDDLKVDTVQVSVNPLSVDTNNDTIEVDDAADDASFHVDLSAFRRTRRR